jgi:hypothetical protein
MAKIHNRLANDFVGRNLLLHSDGLLNRLADGVLASTLANLCQVRTRELGGGLGNFLDVHILGDG